MKYPNDPWYKKTRARSGKLVSGGAALLVHVANGGGQANILQGVGEDAAQQGFERALNAGRRANLRLVE